MDELYEKSQTVDPEVRAYVYSLVNAVGGSSTLDGRYEIGDEALQTLKDLRRWLTLYDEKTGRFDVKRCLAEANLVKGDLLEILAQWEEKHLDSKPKQRLALACLELLVPLTWPLELEEEKTTVNNHRHAPYLQLAHVSYKRAILHHDWAPILKTLARVGLPSMAQPRRERSRRDDAIIRLLLYFFLNMATITQPQHLPSQGDENEISRSSTIDAFHNQDVFSVLLTIGSGCGEEFVEQDVTLLEILFQLLKGVDPKKLFLKKEELNRQDNDELKGLLSKEKAMLGGYAKTAPSRHNRFGTMIWMRRDDAKLSTVSGQKTVQNENKTLQQMDASKKWNKPKTRSKLVKDFAETTDLGMRVDLTDSARKNLRQFVEDFLDSGFNPLFQSIRKAIAGDADRVQRSEFHHHEVMYFYLMSWFLSAERARRDARFASSGWHADRAAHMEDGENTFGYIAAVLDQETFILLNRCMQRAFDEKDYQALQTTLLAFTQILLSVQSMAESKDEEDQEIAENIQNRIFYEETTHDRIVQVLHGAERLGLTYLDAVTECVHVFVRMLERYSKQNADLQIRSKRRTRRKQKQQQGDETADNPEQAAEYVQEAELVTKERKFDFARFSNKFVSQASVDAWLNFISFFRDLSPQQLKRAHRFLYRLAFKNELVVYLFRVDVLLLLHRMIKGPDGLDPEIEGYREWEQLVQQIFRRCVKWMERGTKADAGDANESWRETAIVEMLFSKISNTVFYLQNGYERQVEKRAPRPPAELEVRPVVQGTEARVGVAVGVMIEHSKADQLGWVKAELRRSADERQSWEDAESARLMIGDATMNETAQKDSPPEIYLSPDNEEQKSALFKDKHLRLLLCTLDFERLGLAEDVQATWMIPSKLSAAQLDESLSLIQKFEFDPPIYDGGKSASDMVRSKASAASAARRRPAAANSFDDDDEGASDMDEALFPPNLREKRKKRSVESSTSDTDSSQPTKRRRLHNRAELTEAEREARAAERRVREREKNAKIKSHLFVTASDDESDDEADVEFFRLEEERRQKMAGVIRSALVQEMDQAKAGGKKRDKKRVGSQDSTGEGDDALDSERQDSENEPEFRTKSSSHPTKPASSLDSPVDVLSAEDDDDPGSEAEEETPSTSPPATASHKAKPLEPLPLSELPSNIVSDRIAGSHQDEDEEDDVPVLKKVPRRRNGRVAGFVIEDDSDAE